MSGHVPVQAFRSRIESIAGGIGIVMPSRRSIVLTAFIGLWLAIWLFSVVSMIAPGATGVKVAHGGPPPQPFFVLWFLGAAFALVMFFWTLAGNERVTIDTDTFALRRDVFGVGLTRRYALASVRALRVVDDPSIGSAFGFGRGDPFGLRSGSLAFDYGAKTIRFGSGVDAAEARHILSRVLAAKPALASST